MEVLFIVMMKQFSQDVVGFSSLEKKKHAESTSTCFNVTVCCEAKESFEHSKDIK